MGISISKGNIKMGKIPSVSLPAIITCTNCLCAEKCYARKIERLRPVVAAAYRKNLSILEADPEQYWREVRGTIMMNKFFRFHVSGDIPNDDYFEQMVSVARDNPHCEILCFTKKYSIVNKYLDKHDGVIPDNLHMIFSGWPELKMDNPYHLPEAHVLFRDGTTTAAPYAEFCGGNCTECAKVNGGCWSLGRGEQVVFKEH